MASARLLVGVGGASWSGDVSNWNRNQKLSDWGPRLAVTVAFSAVLWMQWTAMEKLWHFQMRSRCPTSFFFA